MTEVVSLSAARWGKDTNPGAYQPRDAIEAVLRDINEGKVDAAHVIIVLGASDAEGAISTHYYQAGTCDFLTQVGMMAQAQHLMHKRSTE